MSFFILFLGGVVFRPALAQTSAQQLADSLRSQLVEVDIKKSDLQKRREQLEYDLKPENIERALAGVGSTHPEELREHRRRQLELEKTYVLAQLDELAASRTRLEAAIARADLEASRQLVGSDRSNGPTSDQAQPISTALSPSSARRVPRRIVGKHKRVRRPVRQ